MPRAKRPSLTSLFDDLWPILADAGGLESTEAASVALKKRVRMIVEDYSRDGWKKGEGPGRRRVKDRDALIVKLAQAFHEDSGWEPFDDRDHQPKTVKAAQKRDRELREYGLEYRRQLRTFLSLTLA